MVKPESNFIRAEICNAVHTVVIYIGFDVYTHQHSHKCTGRMYVRRESDVWGRERGSDVWRRAVVCKGGRGRVMCGGGRWCVREERGSDVWRREVVCRGGRGRESDMWERERDGE